MQLTQQTCLREMLVNESSSSSREWLRLREGGSSSQGKARPKQLAMTSCDCSIK